MRLYRGLTKEGKWVYGSLVVLKDKESFIIPQWSNADIYDEAAKFRHCYEVIPKTVGQSTGRKDKNGKEMWESDIVTYKVYMSAKFGFPTRKMVWMWSEYHCGLVMKDVDGDRCEAACMIPSEHEIEIIGNIHSELQDE